MRTHRLLATAALVLTLSCTKLGQAPIPSDYHTRLDTWMDNRITSLTSPTGWMRLSDMVWLESDTTEYAGDLVRVSDGKVYHGDVLVFDGTIAEMIQDGTRIWTVIKRGDLYGIRVWDTVNPEADVFTGFRRYPIDTTMVRRARFIPHPAGTTIPITNVLGQTEAQPAPGILEFDLGGVRHRLHPIAGGDRLFVIFGDATNRSETYPAGRFLYVDYPQEGSAITVIDFNMAYNPPCSFSPYTTCQLPPKDNFLSVAVEAGEKRP